MKKVLITTLVILLAIVIFFYGKNYYDNKFESENIEDSYNNIITNENVDNEDKEVQKEIIEEDNNYISIDKSLVRIPILMYHSISDADPNNNLLVSVKQFESEIRWLKENGFTSMSLGDVVKAYDTGYVPKKPVVITFDDGYADNYSDAYRILKENNMKATFFIITDNIDQDSFYMSSTMLKEMKENGMEIENHTSRHIEFTNVSREDKIAIIKEGRETLKEKVGVESKFLCYPVGKYDDETIEVAKELGIEAAVTTENGISSASDVIHTLKRVRISPMEIDVFKDIFQEFLQ